MVSIFIIIVSIFSIQDAIFAQDTTSQEPEIPGQESELSRMIMENKKQKEEIASLKKQRDCINKFGKCLVDAKGPNIEQVTESCPDCTCENRSDEAMVEGTTRKTTTSTTTTTTGSTVLILGGLGNGRFATGIDTFGKTCSVSSPGTGEGLSSSSNVMCSFDWFDYSRCTILNTKTWTDTSSLQTDRQYSSMVPLTSGVLNLGGKRGKTSSEFLAVGTNVWVPGPAIPGKGVSRSCAVSIPEDKVIVIGGEYDRTQVRVLDFKTKQWTSWTSFPEPGVCTHDCYWVQGLGVLIVGGFDGRSRDAQTWLLNIETGEYEEVAPLNNMNIARDGHKIVELDGRILVVGGTTDNGPTSLIEEFVPGSMSWTPLDPWTLALDQPRSYFGVLEIPNTDC